MTLSADTPLDILLQNHMISRHTYNSLLSANYSTVGDVMARAVPISQLLKLPRFGKASLSEISRVVKMADSSVTAKGPQARSESALNYTHMVSTFPQPYLDNLQDKYTKLISEEKDRRCQKFLQQNLPTILSATKYIDADLLQFMNLCPGRIMENTLRKAQAFINQLKTLIQTTGRKSSSEISLENIKHMNPLFTDSECQFLLGFSLRYQYEPTLFRVLTYIRHSSFPQFKFYRLYVGIEDGTPHTIQQISSMHQCTYEYVRKKIKEIISDSSHSFPFPMNLSGYPKLMSSTYLTETSKVYERIRDRELNGISFRLFSQLMILFGQHELIELEGHNILLKKTIPELCQMRQAIKSIEVLMKKKYPETTIIDIRPLLKDFQDAAIGTDIVEICNYICTKIYGCEQKSDEEYIIGQNHVDVSYDLYHLLEANGSPMSLDELFAKFKEKNPSHHYTHPSQIRNHLHKHRGIKSVGKKSIYGLSSWEKVSYSSLIESIVSLLESSSAPLRLKEIFEKISSSYPWAKEKNIYTIMMADTQKRIVRYPNGHYGLKGRIYKGINIEVHA